jgi:hypothetical protein
VALYPNVPQFTHDQLQRYRYWYELHPYTAYDAALPPGEETIFEFQNLPSDVPNQLALLTHLGTTNTANISLRVDGPVTSRTENTTAFPSGLLPVMAGNEEGERSTTKMALKWLNNTGATATTVQQVNYAGALKQLTTADKVMRGLTLDATDLALQKKYQIYNQGLRPLTIEEMKDRIWRRAILDNDFLAATVDVGTTSLDIPPYTVPAGTVVVLHTLAVSIPSNAVGNFITLSIDRDTQRGQIQVLLDNAPTPGLLYPWPLWLTVTNSFAVHLIAQTATSGVSIRIGWYRVKITGLLSVVLGQTNPADLTGVEKELYDRLRAGVVA